MCGLAHNTGLASLFGSMPPWCLDRWFDANCQDGSYAHSWSWLFIWCRLSVWGVDSWVNMNSWPWPMAASIINIQLSYGWWCLSRLLWGLLGWWSSSNTLLARFISKCSFRCIYPRTHTLAGHCIECLLWLRYIPVNQHTTRCYHSHQLLAFEVGICQFGSAIDGAWDCVLHRAPQVEICQMYCDIHGTLVRFQRRYMWEETTKKTKGERAITIWVLNWSSHCQN
jgi:hypothetical protein